ncbi:hypothetical protein LBMAG56_21120 [Verrucomicrobiota bacterium]|nr:hypothetical protein LBMAG56_21120 [Verrucomicrobiota bacterium]
MSISWLFLLAVSTLVLSTHTHAAEITIRLLRADAPDQLVSTAITKIDLAAEEAKAKDDAAKAARRGTPAAKEAEIKPQAQFDHYANYMRGIVINAKHPFQRTYLGSFLGRTDVLTLDLADGEHVIDPGAHKFTVSGGQVAAQDPSLRANGRTLDVLLHPVTIMAVDGSAIRPMPAEVRRLPVAPRLYWGTEELLPKEQILSAATTFKRLTLYLLANITGPGYRVSPTDRNFHLTADGIAVLDESGKPATDNGVFVENRFTLVLPKSAVPVTVRGKNVQVLITGPAGNLKLASAEKDSATGTFFAYSARDGADITVGNRDSNQPVKFHGDLGRFPRRRIIVDATAPESREPRLLAVSLAGYSLDAGQPLRVRIQFQDALDNSTLTPPQVAAFLWREPVLGEDGWLRELPADAPAAGWQTLAVRATGEAELFDIVAPEVPGSVYRLRIVVDRRGKCSPQSALHADFIQGILDPASRATLSAFCPIGRHAFLQGGEMPFSVVLKNAAPVPAGKLRVTLRCGDGEFTLVERDIPAVAAGQHPLHFRLDSRATAALSAGDYQLTATLGELRAAPWSVRIAQPRFREPFAHFDHNCWSAWSMIDAGFPYLTAPKGIAEANEGRRALARNAAILGRQGNLNLTDWGIGPGGAFPNYQGRDSSSEVAEVEMILRRTPSLPAHEAFYYQNRFETVHEALAAQGMGELNSVLSGFIPYSLVHSVEKEVNAEMRKFQLVAQTADKFDNFTGMSLVKADTAPIGNAELGDSGRTLRLIEQMKNFEAKHKFRPPPAGHAAANFNLSQTGKTPPAPIAENGRRFEAWAEEENTLLADFYKQARIDVEPLLPGLRYAALGPPGYEATWAGGYPGLAQRDANLLTVQCGCGDYGQTLIYEPFVRTRFIQMTGKPCWGVLGLSTAGPTGFYNTKQHLAGYLAAGVKGFGYRDAWREVTGPQGGANLMGIQEEREDIAALLRTYGPMLAQLEPRAPIAVFYPFHQSIYQALPLDLPGERMVSPQLAAYAALAQLAMLGHDAEVLSEERIDAGDLSRFKMVLLPNLHYLLPRHREALEKYTAGGGHLLAGARSTLLPKGAKKITDDFTEVHECNATWSLNALHDVGHAWLFGEMRRKAAALAQDLAPLVQPFARPTSDRVFVQTTHAGDGRYTFVWNTLYPSWMGTTRVRNNPEWSAGLEAVEQTLMPLKETVQFPADRFTYELFTQERVAAGAAKDGRADAVADLSFTPFRVFVSLPRAIAKLQLDAPASVEAGRPWPVKVTPLDGDGKPINASIPLSLALLDATGKAVWKSSGSAFPTFSGELSAPAGSAPGQWKIQVSELVSGRQIESTVTVAAGQTKSFAAAVRELPEVDVQRPDLVAQFVAARRKDGQPVIIVLDDSQAATRQALAQDAAKALQQLGIKAEVRRASQPGVFANEERVHLYSDWRDINPAQHVANHIVLLGGEGESVLLEELQENQLFTRPLTASYPGPGRGVLTVVRSPFAYNRDVLCLLGPDEKGIRAALAALVTTSQTAAGGVVRPPSDPRGGDGSSPLRLKRRTADGDEPSTPQTPLITHALAGKLVPGTPFALMDGAPVQRIAVSADGARVAFGTMGYATNLFVFDSAGKLLAEDKVGHVNTAGLAFLDGGRVGVESDGAAYLREADGTLRWRLRGLRHLDPQGRYCVLPLGNGFEVLTLDLKPRWKFDEWDAYETAQEILFSRQATFVAALDAGDTLVYRLTGKAPGLAGEAGDDLIFCDALTGKEKRRVAVALAPLAAFAGLAEAGTKLQSLEFVANGSLVLATLTSRAAPEPVAVLLDGALRPLLAERFTVPAYLAGTQTKTQRRILADRRQIFTVGDTVCLADAQWASLASARTANLILSLAVDEARQRIAVANYSGHVEMFDFALKRLWHAELGSAAQLAFLPDGRLAAGTLRGQATLLDAEGKSVWSASLNRYAEPEVVEQRWAQLEALPGVQRPDDLPWWEQLKKSVPLGDDIAGVTGKVTARDSLGGNCNGEPFGTYLVEWRHKHVKGAARLALDITEVEKAAANQNGNAVRRVTLSALPSANEGVAHAVLRLGDRAERINVTVQLAGDGEATSTVTLRPLRFPSENLIRIPSLYRGEISEATRANPPVTVGIYKNVTELDDPHDTAMADPFALVNGRALESEPSLLKGNWFGDGSSLSATKTYPSIPCWIELTLPAKRVISHIVIAEDPAQPRVEPLSVDAFVESRETRAGLSDFERRQLKRGFWLGVVKARSSSHPYHIYQFAKPVFTNKLRVYVLGGHSSITEIELYGAAPKKVAAAAAVEKGEQR